MNLLATTSPRLRASAPPRCSPRRLASLTAGMLLLSGVAFAQGSADWYVDANLTTGTQIGTTWDNAFTDLDSALQAALSGESIWVAIGTYETQIGAGRNKTFTIPNGVSVFGGFVNGDQTLPGSAKYRETILSGDIDVGGVPAADAYHVVTVQAGLVPVGIDGFVITGGVADGQALFAEDQGGGIRCVGSDLELRNCVITINFATDGAGLYFQGTGTEGNTLTAYRCTFSNNRAVRQGGGARIDHVARISTTEPSWLFNCRFTRNSAGPTVKAIFDEGGGGLYLGERIYADASTTTTPVFLVMNGLFTDNFVRGDGAALFIFEDGIADTALLKDNVEIQNSTFAFNTVVDSNDATGGGAIYVSAMEPRGVGVALPVSSVLTSSIVWLNTTLSNATPIAGPGATTIGTAFQDTRLLVRASDVMYPGGTYPAFSPSVASINADPIFVNNASRDLRLQGPASPCIDFGMFTVADLPFDFPDMNNASGALDKTPYEFYGPRARIINITPDIGCHEHQGATP